MDPSAERYQNFLSNVNKIAADWGYGEKEHNGGLWSTQDWVTEWHSNITEDLWRSCPSVRYKLADEILDPRKAHTPDIYDRLFPSVERLAGASFCHRLGRSKLFTLKWIRQLVRKDIRETAAENLETLARHAQDPDQTNLMESLRVARSPLGHEPPFVGAYPLNEYGTWLKTISTRVQALSVAPEVNAFQVAAVLQACLGVVKQTYDRSTTEGVSDLLLVQSYLPDSPTFDSLCRQNLHEPYRERVTEAQVEKRRGTDGGGPRKRHSSSSSGSLAPLAIPPASSSYNAPTSATSSIFSSPLSSPTSIDHFSSSMPPPPRRRRTSSNHHLPNYHRRGSSISSVPESPLHHSFTSDNFSSSSFGAQNHPSGIRSSSQPVITSSSPQAYTNNAYVAVSRQDTPEAMIEVIEAIARIYGRMDRKSQDEARDRLTRLLNAATSGEGVDGRVVGYLRRLQELTIHQLPYSMVLPVTIDGMLGMSGYSR